jgi:hypothetical protein
MIRKNSYEEDTICYFQINKGDIPIGVHVHVINEDNKVGKVDLKFTVFENFVVALIPANLEYIFDPELMIQLNSDKKIHFRNE